MDIGLPFKSNLTHYMHATSSGVRWQSAESRTPPHWNRYNTGEAATDAWV